MKKTGYFWLIPVIFVFFLTRLYKIDQVPPSLYWDEASIGYNAYSILETGRDEWGEFLPLHFRAFGEFKLPVYIYSVVSWVKLFGLNAWAVRLPAVLYSLGVVILVYILAGKITGRKWVGLLAAFLLTISPWFFIFSRTGYEATAGLFFFLLGTYFLLFLNSKGKFLVGGVLSLVFSFYSYNSFRVIVPIWLVIIFLYLVKKGKFKNELGLFLLSFLIFFLSLIPVYRLYKFDAGATRFGQVTLSHPADFFRNYWLHFSPDFLFLGGDSNPRSQIPGYSQLYWIDLPFILAGFYAVLKKRKPALFLPLVFLLLAPLPAALTKESPHALRSILAAPAWGILASIGIWYWLEKVRFGKIWVMSTIIILYSLSFSFWWLDFLNQYKNLTSSAWQYGYKQVFENYAGEFGKYNRIVISDSYAQPYIFALYYLNYPPEKFWLTVKYNSVDRWGFSAVGSFDKFEFKKIEADDLLPGNLVFAAEGEKIKGEEPISKVTNLDGSVAFWVYSK